MKTVALPATSLSGSFSLATPRVDRGVVLDRPVDHQIASQAPHGLGGLAHRVDLRALGRVAGGIGEHRDPRGDAERRRGVRGADRDVRELCAVGLGVDRAVAVDQHAVGEAHEEDARDDRDAGAGLDELERRADRVAGV